MNDEQRKPIDIPEKSFSQRVSEGWEAFAAGEETLRTMMDSKTDSTEALVTYCGELLAPAFGDICFELGFNGEKYELILTAEDVRAELFKLVYFQQQMPNKLQEKWNVIVGRRPTQGEYELKMFGLHITAADVKIWIEKQENSDQIGLTLYCKKLIPLMKENENAAFTMLALLIDQVIGEIISIRFVAWKEAIKRPPLRRSMPLAELPEYLKTQGGLAEDWRDSYTADDLLAGLTTYKMNGTDMEPAYPREDILVGFTSAADFINGYFSGDDVLMDSYLAVGAVPGFLYYDISEVDKTTFLDLRDEIQGKLQDELQDEITFIGGATAPNRSYLDLIAWNLPALLKAADKIFADTEIPFAAFHSFSKDSVEIGIKGRRILED